MSAFEILIAIYLAVVPPALGVLFWGRFNRLESRMDAFELKVATEFTDVRREITALRSDLTQVALAVGARPRASEA
jgi:hypothetical protein